MDFARTGERCSTLLVVAYALHPLCSVGSQARTPFQRGHDEDHKIEFGVNMNFRGQMNLAAENRYLSESEPIPEAGSLD